MTPPKMSYAECFQLELCDTILIKMIKQRIQLMLKLIEGSLEVKLPTIWTDEKQRREESERREE